MSNGPEDGVDEEGSNGDGSRPGDGNGSNGDGSRPGDGNGSNGDGSRPGDGNGSSGEGSRPGDRDGPTVAGRTPTPPEDRRRTALLWGVAGLLSFGVVHQGYLLLGGRFLGVAPVVAVAVLVGVATGLSAYWLAGRLGGRNEQR